LLLLALHNLIDNALKFTRPGDTIEVRASEDGSAVVIEVADTGPGIPEAELPHVWEELYRGERARGVPGSGLGLALVRAIIDQHRGRIVMRSLVNQGTVITLWLPVASFRPHPRARMQSCKNLAQLSQSVSFETSFRAVSPLRSGDRAGLGVSSALTNL
jgi:two-component system OmpR family sensor kinase